MQCESLNSNPPPPLPHDNHGSALQFIYSPETPTIKYIFQIVSERGSFFLHGQVKNGGLFDPGT